jgi:hypothetical protein
MPQLYDFEYGGFLCAKTMFQKRAKINDPNNITTTANRCPYEKLAHPLKYL